MNIEKKIENMNKGMTLLEIVKTYPEQVVKVLQQGKSGATDGLVAWNELMKKTINGCACKHENYSKKTVMDFSFYVCSDCGYQWRA